MERSKWVAAPLVLAMALLSACVVTPEEGGPVATPGATIEFTGLALDGDVVSIVQALPDGGINLMSRIIQIGEHLTWESTVRLSDDLSDWTWNGDAFETSVSVFIGGPMKETLTFTCPPDCIL